MIEITGMNCKCGGGVVVERVYHDPIVAEPVYVGHCDRCGLPHNVPESMVAKGQTMPTSGMLRITIPNERTGDA